MTSKLNNLHQANAILLLTSAQERLTNLKSDLRLLSFVNKF